MILSGLQSINLDYGQMELLLLFRWDNKTPFLILLVHYFLFIVQVHNRVKYLRKLLLSLSQSRWIEKALLIFSHNIYSEELNEMVYSIPFCSVMQIYFPFSLQLYPSTFPGESPRDCPRDITKLRYVRYFTDFLH